MFEFIIAFGIWSFVWYYSTYEPYKERCKERHIEAMGFFKSMHPKNWKYM